MMVGTKWKVIQEASSFELRQGGMGGMAMMNPMMVHPSPSSTSLLSQRMTLILTLSTGHGRHGRHRYDEPDDGNGRLREYIRLVTRSIMTSKSPAKHDSQGMPGGGLGSGAYGVGIGSPYTSTWLPSWVQQLMYRTPWYT